MKMTLAQRITTVVGVGALALGAVATAPAGLAAPSATMATTATASMPVSQASGPRTALVAAWYQQFLDRSAADDPGSRYWVVRLRSFASSFVLAEILRSSEAATKQVDDLYADLLDRRTSGDAGARYWIDGVGSGDFPVEWVEQNLLASEEFVLLNSEANRDPGNEINAWYRDILGRFPRGGEVTYWAGRLNGSSPLGVVREIWYTPEAVSQRIAGHYDEYLQRTANPGEIAFWYGPEVTSDIGVVISIASSAEYLSNAPR